MSSAVLSSTLANPFKRIPWPRHGALYVFCLPALAGTAAMRGDSLTICGFNYTGFLWTGALAVGAVLLLAEKGARRQVRSYFPLLPWLPWLAVMGASLAWVEHGGLPEVRDAVQLGMPVLVGVIAGQFVRSPERMQQLIKAFYWSIPILWAFSLLWFFTDLDQYWRTDMYVEKRALALTAVVIGGLAVAGGKREPLLGCLMWFACFGVTMITGSRTASLVMLMLPLLNPVTRNPQRKMLAMLSIASVALIIYMTPVLQDRFSRREPGNLSGNEEAEFDSSGRFEAWPLILDEAMRYAWLGHGVGTAQRFVPEVWPGVVAPHNDYLRIGYEEGIIGLTVFLAVMIWQILSLRRLIRHSDGVVQQFAGAAWLGWIAFVIIAYTDNPITYSLCFMNPLFAMMGVAYAAARSNVADSTSAAPSNGALFAAPLTAPACS